MLTGLLNALVEKTKNFKLIDSERIINLEQKNKEHLSFQLYDKEIVIPLTLIKQEFNRFFESRVYRVGQVNTEPKSLIIASLFAQFPFVMVSKKNDTLTVKLLEFKTDDLPSEQIRKVIVFLDEVVSGKYVPANLSKELRDDPQLYRIKSRARQDLRMLGFLDNTHQEKDELILNYSQASDKSLYMQKIILDNSFFRMAMDTLLLLEDEEPRAKKRVLIELAMKLVKNSRGENYLVESLGVERVTNLLNWLQHYELVDENFQPENKYGQVEGQIDMTTTNLRVTFESIFKEYIKARNEKLSAAHPMSQLITRNLVDEIKTLPFINDGYLVKASVGMGKWTHNPWLALMNKEITETTQSGYYIVYLFHEEMKRLYLTFGQGIKETKPERMAEVKEKFRERIEMEPKVKTNDEIILGEAQRGKGYAKSTAAYIEYSADALPPEEVLVSDLEKMIGYYEQYIEIEEGRPRNENTQSNYQQESIQEEREIIREEMVDIEIPEVVDHIHSYITSKGFYYEKEEVTNLFLSLKAKPFVILSGILGTGKTMMVRWFAESVGADEENGRFTLIPVRPDWSDGSDLLGYVDIKGDFNIGPLTKVLMRAMDDPTNSYFVLLDEMNLARVEHYFSDLLSVMESKKWKDGQQITSKVLPFDVEGKEVYIPSNLYLIGTVNMDETTYPFSKKVLDRANTIEFNRVKLDNLSFLMEQEEKSAVILHNDKFKSQYLTLKDLYQSMPQLVEEVTRFLVKVNEVLQVNGSHVGYRVRDEICFYVAYSQSYNLLSMNEAIDNCLLQKILPRLAGSDSRIKGVLQGLYKVFTNKVIAEAADIVTEDIQDAKYPKSTEKIADMLRRLEDDGFTSFWISQ
ncbi:McrB family protein [Alkalihalobacillus sp. 1P02AB]|uniref:McrB family protein n=1 Tax=Alkalihalobacillus sp. 1P02AB TaxID=3132260 RepID=UPI0039A64EB9